MKEVRHSQNTPQGTKSSFTVSFCSHTILHGVQGVAPLLLLLLFVFLFLHIHLLPSPLLSPQAAEVNSGQAGWAWHELQAAHLRTAAMTAAAAAVQNGTAHTWAAGRGTNRNKIEILTAHVSRQVAGVVC